MTHPVEIERRYLLSGVPPRVAGEPADTIEQGWIPGKVIRERVRRRVSPEGVTTYTRTLKIGAGLTRIELEETCEAALFEALWVLTSAKRIAKTRTTLAHGALHWEVDIFPTLDLVLAEVELPSEDTDVTLPDWLAPYVVREVTTEPGWTNASIAERGVPGRAR